MAYDIGPKIGIDGEAEFRAELSRINTGLKTLGTEMAAVTSEFIGQEKSVESLTKENDVLQRTIYSLNERLEMQKRMLAESAAAYGEADAKTQAWQQAVNRTTAEINKNNAQIQENNKAIEKLSESETFLGQVSDTLNGYLQPLGLSIQNLTMLGVVGLAVTAIKQLIGFFKEATTEAAAYADGILTLSTNYGIATDRLQEYQYMAELTDTSVDTITGAIAKLTKNMSAAKDGTGKAAEAFELLGVRILDGNGQLRDSSDVFEEVIDHLGYVENATERDALAMDIFGKSAMELNSLIAVGADGMDAFAEEARAMGYVLSDEDLEALGAVDDSFRRLDNMMTASKNRMAAEYAPQLVDLAEKLLDIAGAVDWEAFGRGVKGALDLISPIIILISEALAGLAMILSWIFELIGKGIDFVGKGIDTAKKYMPSGYPSNIPGMAEGGVIEPGNPRLYVLGDNPTEREIVSPRSEMVSATMEAMRMGGYAGGITINFTGDLAQLGRVLQPVITRDSARIGAVI